MHGDPRPPPRPSGPQEQLAQVIGRAVSDSIKPLQAQVGAIDEEVERQGKILTGLLGTMGLRAEQQANPDDLAEDARAPSMDTIWGCRKCQKRLGMYDQEEDVLRMRRNDLLVHVHAGVGGWIRVACPGCGELNVIEYAPSAAEMEGGLPQVEAVGDRVVLDEPLLLRLLEHVREAGGRQVVQVVQAPQPSPL